MKTRGQPGYSGEGQPAAARVQRERGYSVHDLAARGTITPRLDANYTSVQTFMFSPSIQAPSGPRDIAPAAYDPGTPPSRTSLVTTRPGRRRLRPTNLDGQVLLLHCSRVRPVTTAGVIAPAAGSFAEPPQELQKDRGNRHDDETSGRVGARCGRPLMPAVSLRGLTSPRRP